MERIGLKHRSNFLENYLGPAISHGFVTPLHPDISRYPRQKYLLTAEGAFVFEQFHQMKLSDIDIQEVDGLLKK